jgi:hypothetical protein
MTRRLRLAAFLGLLGSLAVLGGCGGGSGTSVTGEPISFTQLSQAASTSADVSSGRFGFSMEMTMPGTTETFAFSGAGAFDTESNRSEFTFDFSSFAKLLGGLLTGLGAPAEGAPDFNDPSAWQIDAIQDGETMYMRFPALDSELPKGKSWVRMEAGAEAQAQGFDLSQFQPFTGDDRSKMLDVLQAASGEVETVGTEELHGVATTHYRATVDLAEYEKLVPAAQRDEAGTMVEGMLEQLGSTELPVDVWLDEQGLVRQLEMSFSAAQPGTTESAEASVMFELYDYGEDVEVELPRADDVVDAATLD